MFRKLLALSLSGLLLAGCSAPAPDDPGQEHSLMVENAMSTDMSLKIYGGSDALLEEAEDLIRQLEAEISTTDPHSAMSELNRNGTAQLSPGAAALTERALELCADTQGTLDISIYPVVRAWGFTTGSYRIPAPEELADLLTHVDYTKISLEENRISIPQGMMLDLGSVAKGYTGDLLAGLFRDNGVTSALMNLGGNVQAVGKKPDGSPWRVGIQDPKSTDYMGILEVDDQAVVTSGGYERYFTGEDGQIYWHIIDPADGAPAKNGLISATIVGKEGLRCDALSTATFIMGPEKAIEYWAARRDFGMILVTEEGQLIVTPDLADRFTPTETCPYTPVLLNVTEE